MCADGWLRRCNPTGSGHQYDTPELSMINRSTFVTDSKLSWSKSGGQTLVWRPFGHRCRNRRSFSTSRTRRATRPRADPRSSVDLRRFRCTSWCRPHNRAHGRLVCSKSAARQNCATKRTNTDPTRCKKARQRLRYYAEGKPLLRTTYQGMGMYPGEWATSASHSYNACV